MSFNNIICQCNTRLQYTQLEETINIMDTCLSKVSHELSIHELSSESLITLHLNTLRGGEGKKTTTTD